VHADAVTAAYPSHREATVVLRDGSTLTIRPVRADDAGELGRFFADLSLESRVLRFFAAVVNADSSIQRMVNVNYTSSYGLVAVAGAPSRVVGHAMYVEFAPRKAELALAVADAYQGRGVGTILLGQLAEAAAASGYDVLEAVVLPENHRMLQMLRESGFPVHARSEPGEVRADLLTKIGPEGIRHFEDRERLAAVASVTHLLAPASVAVIGASRKNGSIGAAVMHNIVAYGYRGRLYPVNPAATEIEGVPAFPSVLAIPGDVEMAVVTVPAAVVAKVARECARREYWAWL
jgi:GNAT superfamily N-acetyltransferase